MTDNDIVSKFKSNQNKGIIWGLLNDHNVFSGIDVKYVNSIKKEFDSKVEHISNTISNNDTMVALNKKVIAEMMNEMNRYKMPISIMPITSADAQLQKQTLFQKNLETKQSEFDTLINKPKPNTIDFSDTNGQDKPNSSEMERKLAETIAWREKQLNVVLDTQYKTEANISGANISEARISEASISEASKWINRDNVSPSTNNILLKIDKNTPVDISVINLDNKFKKKVSFPDAKDAKELVPDVNNFLSLLKKKDTHNIADNISYNLEDDIIIMKTQIKELMEKQNVILDNQNVILENQKVMLKIITELHANSSYDINPSDDIKSSDNINPSYVEIRQ